MKVLVCDDEQLARERLARLVSDMDGYEVVGEAVNGAEAVQRLSETDADIVLMDIRMPQMDGLEAAKLISQKKAPPAIIFCTAYDDHALQAFNVNAVGYLLKPVRREALAEALGKARSLNRVQLSALQQVNAANDQTHGKQRTHISAKTHRGIELVPVDDIRYFLADQKYVTVRSGRGEVLIDETLKELEDEFGERFVRIHRNSLVARRFIDGLEQVSTGHYQVRLRDTEERLTVSRRHVSGLRRLLQHL
ncbi:MAG: LytR/AlgR family response regulator transcription factor [Gammaproteobacteria bacterium]